MSDEIMTIREVADYMKMNERTIYKLAQGGEIPAVKVANQWRLKKRWVDEWLESQMRVFGPRWQARVEKGQDEGGFRIADLFREEVISTNLAATTGEEVLEELVDLLVMAGFLRLKGPFLRAVKERESLYTTAIEPGLAIPHSRWALAGQVVEPAIAFGRSRKGIDFGSLDGGPTFLFFLPCAPEDGLHLRILARLAKLLRCQDLVGELKQAEVSREVIRLIANKEGYPKREESCWGHS